jgi:hypothetical protein
MISGPYVSSGARVAHTSLACWPAGRSSREDSAGPIPLPVVRIKMRGNKRESERTPALGWGRVHSFNSFVCARCVRRIRRRVQSPALETSMCDCACEADGNVANGCHSRHGEVETERQEKR